MIESAVAALSLLLLTAVANPASPPVVSGSLVLGGSEFTARDAVAFSRDGYEGRRIVVLLSETPLAKETLRATLDQEGAIEALKGEGSSVELEYAEDGTWSKLKYSLKYGSSSTSGTRYDAAVAPAMKVEIHDGVVTGKLDASLDVGESLKLTLAVPVVVAPAGSPLPADGGPPAQALRACTAAHKARKLDDVKRSCSELLGGYIDSAIRWKADSPDADDPWSPAAAGHCEVATLTDLQLTEGVVHGEEARFKARGEWVQDGQPATCAGPVFLRKVGGSWRVTASRLDTVSE